MELSGSTVLAHSPSVVWGSLYDADTIKKSISGCVELEWVSDSELKGVIRKKFGPVKSTFPLVLSVCDVVEFESYTMRGSSKGSAFGYVDGEAKIRLEETGGGCELHYEADIRMGGKIAQIGSRLMSSASKKIVADFFEAFFEQIESENESSQQTDGQLAT